MAEKVRASETVKTTSHFARGCCIGSFDAIGASDLRGTQPRQLHLVAPSGLPNGPKLFADIGQIYLRVSGGTDTFHRLPPLESNFSPTIALVLSGVGSSTTPMPNAKKGS